MKFFRNFFAKSLLLASCLGVGVVAGELISPSEDLKLDFSEQKESINKLVQSAKPMAEHLQDGIVVLDKLIKDVKDSPTALNKSRFELSFSKHICTLVNDLDEMIQHREEIEWAFQDIVDEVKRVAKRLDYQNERIKEKLFQSEFKVKDMKKQLQKLARKIEAKGGKDAPQELIREFNNLHRRYKMMNRTCKVQRQVQKQLHNTLGGLGKNGSSIQVGANNIKGWFDNLKNQRDAFLTLAEARKDMTMLTQLMHQGGANSIIKTFGKLQGIQKQLDLFNTTFEKMGDNMDVLQTFDPNDLTIESTSEVKEEVWKEFL